MKACKKVHEEYDRYANGQVELGRLPDWLHVTGRVAWHVHQGPYSSLPQAWRAFGQMLQSLGTEKFAGPPGDVYACDPEDHKGPAEAEMITILWAPLKE